MLTHWYRAGVRRWFRRWWWAVALAILFNLVILGFFLLNSYVIVNQDQLRNAVHQHWTYQLYQTVRPIIPSLSILIYVGYFLLVPLICGLTRVILFLPSEVVMVTDSGLQYRLARNWLRGIAYTTLVLIVGSLTTGQVMAHQWIETHYPSSTPNFALAYLPMAACYLVMASEVLVWSVVLTRFRGMLVLLGMNLLVHVAMFTAGTVILTLGPGLNLPPVRLGHFVVDFSYLLVVAGILAVAGLFFRLNQRMHRDFRGWLAA